MGQQEDALAMMQKREAAEKRIEDRKNGIAPREQTSQAQPKAEPEKQTSGGLIIDIIISVVFAVVVTALVMYYRPLY